MPKYSNKSQPSKTGRPAGFSRSEAINLAMNLFWQKGFQGVSAKDLAESMAIQRSSFYNSFGSKEAVFTEVLERYASISPDAMLNAIKPDAPVLPSLVQMLRELCRIRANDRAAKGCLVCNSLADLGVFDQKNAGLLEQSVVQRTKLLERLLSQSAEQREICLRVEVETAAHSFIVFLIGLNILSKVVRDETQLWATCKHFLKGFGIPDSILEN
ncbi:MAG: TetR/AcrR family transcriptional regulator [Gammaproteobacteria bacterium]